jgi:hypothetical protein
MREGVFVWQPLEWDIPDGPDQRLVHFIDVRGTLSGGKFDMDLNEQAQRGYGLLAETAKLNRPDRNRCSTPLRYH